MKKAIIILTGFIGVLTLFGYNTSVKADELTDSVNEQIERLDLSGLESYYQDILGDDESITDKIKDMLLSGEL